MSAGNLLSDAAVEKLASMLRQQDRRIINLERRLAQYSTRRHQIWFPPVATIYGGFLDSASSQTLTGGAGMAVIHTLASSTENNGVTLFDDGTESYIEIDTAGVYAVWFGGSVTNTGLSSTLVQFQLTVESGTAGTLSRLVPRIHFRVTTSAEADTFSGVAWQEMSVGEKIRMTGSSSVGDVQTVECYMLAVRLG